MGEKKESAVRDMMLTVTGRTRTHINAQINIQQLNVFISKATFTATLLHTNIINITLWINKIY